MPQEDLERLSEEETVNERGRPGRPPREDRSLVAEGQLQIRITAAERAVLEELVAIQNREVGAERGARVTASSYVRSLIAREARAHGIDPPEAPAPPAKKGAKPARKPKK
jgi:hypothetical protein